MNNERLLNAQQVMRCNYANHNVLSFFSLYFEYLGKILSVYVISTIFLKLPEYIFFYGDPKKLGYQYK